MSFAPEKKSFPIALFLILVAGVAAALFFSLGGPKHSGKDGRRTLGVSAKAQTADSNVNQKLHQFSLTGFDQHGKIFWNLEGENASIDPNQRVTLDDHVTLKLREGTLVKTDHVQWSQEEGVLRTHAAVHVHHSNVRIRGQGAVGRPKDSFLQLNRNVTMILSRTTRLTCDGPMKIFYEENKMIFYRRVKVTDSRGFLTANRMDVFFDPVSRKVDHILAIGDVVIERDGDITHSQRALYSLPGGSVRLEGNPEITLHKQSAAGLNGTFRS